MKILAIDTSTEACSVALLNHGEIIQQYEHQPQQQANLVLPMCQRLLTSAGVNLAQLDAIAFCHGPGSFTGLRVAAAVVQGIASAYDLAVIPVSTLATLAWGEYQRTQHPRIMACLDARMQEVYWACYCIENEQLVTTVAETVCLPADVHWPDEVQKWRGTGSGWKAYHDVLSIACGGKACNANAEVWPQAQYLLQLARLALQAGQVKDVTAAIPHYIRDKVAKKKAER